MAGWFSSSSSEAKPHSFEVSGDTKPSEGKARRNATCDPAKPLTAFMDDEVRTLYAAFDRSRKKYGNHLLHLDIKV